MSYSELAPIVLFCYNRPQILLNTLSHLRNNSLASRSSLILYCDGPKKFPDPKVDEVRSIAHQITGFKSVTTITRECNWGLAPNIIDGVTKTVSKFGKAIILEDDLVVSPFFLEFMNQSLSVYQNDPSVASICGWVPPLNLSNKPDTFFLSHADCLGWATWARAWKCFEPDTKLLYRRLMQLPVALRKKFNHFNNYNYVGLLRLQIQGLVNSWAIRWKASAFLHEMLSLYPGHSLVYHCDSFVQATHCNFSFPQEAVSNFPIPVHRIPISERPQMLLLYGEYEKKAFQNQVTPMKIFRNWGNLFYFKLRSLLKRSKKQASDHRKPKLNHM